jgi:Nitrile hydratase, alpha chain
VLLLSLAGPRFAAGLVQVRALSFACGDRPTLVLSEFGLELPEDVEVRVWDSTAELRYLVLPERPTGSEELSEKALAALVTRDAMIGVVKAKLPRKGGPT